MRNVEWEMSLEISQNSTFHIPNSTLLYLW